VEFNLDDEIFVQVTYNYLINIIPGSGMFMTRTFLEWVDGFEHPFLKFFGSLDIYSGGIPGVKPYFAVKKEEY
jgi:hypothetical protein